jgi:hypothetical protein
MLLFLKKKKQKDFCFLVLWSDTCSLDGMVAGGKGVLLNGLVGR